MSVPPSDDAIPQEPRSKRLRVRSKSSPVYMSMLEAMGREGSDANERIYLVTLSRVKSKVFLQQGYPDLRGLSR